MVAPLVSKVKSRGRWADTGSDSVSFPASARSMTSAAITVLVLLAMPNDESMPSACASSAVPAAPDHLPRPATMTVALTPGRLKAARSRTACSAAAVSLGRASVGGAGKRPRPYGAGSDAVGDAVEVELAPGVLGTPGVIRGPLSDDPADVPHAPTMIARTVANAQIARFTVGASRGWDLPPGSSCS